MSTRYGGYMGKVMVLDLSKKKVAEYPWTDRDRELYIGGKMMGAKILSDLFSGKETGLLAEYRKQFLRNHPLYFHEHLI